MHLFIVGVWIWFVFALTSICKKCAKIVILNIITEWGRSVCLFSLFWLLQPVVRSPDVSQLSLNTSAFSLYVNVCCPAAKSFMAIFGVIGGFLFSFFLERRVNSWSGHVVRLLQFHNITSNNIVFQFYGWFWHQLSDANETLWLKLGFTFILPQFHPNITGFSF